MATPRPAVDGAVLLHAEGARVLADMDVNRFDPGGQMVVIQIAKAVDRIAWLEAELAAGSQDAMRLMDAIARQAGLLKGLLSELRNWMPEPELAEQGGDALDELARQRAARFTASAS